MCLSERKEGRKIQTQKKKREKKREVTGTVAGTIFNLLEPKNFKKKKNEKKHRKVFMPVEDEEDLKGEQRTY